MKKVEPFADDKRMIFAKLYINNNWFEELSLHLPNELFRFFHPDMDIEEFLYITKFVEYSSPSIPFFPFELNFSLINEGVVELDSIFSKPDEKNKNNTYKPYFYEFSGYCKSWNDLRKLFSYYIKNDYGCFTCFLDFSEEDNYDRNDIIAVIDGNVLFSASPIEEKSGKLVVVENSSSIDPKFIPVLDDSIYKCSTSPIDESGKIIFNGAIDNLKLSFKPKNAIIYNVGQGNNVSIELNGGKHIFFDIGLTKSRVERNQSEIKAAIKEFSKIKPEIVILSHWDIDHILGVSYANHNIYNAVWIVPNLWALMKYTYKNSRRVLKLKYISDSAKRLLKYLDFKNDKKLFIIDENWTNNCIYSSKDNKMCIWIGKRKSAKGINGAKEPYIINEANNFGLIITLENHKNILLSGDCEYSIMPSDIWKKGYQYLLASHHCSKMSQIPLVKSSSNKKAILSYGVTNIYGHPNKQHIRELADIGYQINTTLGHRHIRCDL
ncbi:MBL fold metallo-hydrolase [Clostridium autoethanogenum]|uniref:MBL fold metallo-hydrolase n=2 Tax=Clostridium autoethanogenum TaxID=84023 RepID=A0A3M0S3G6_9CLOT|nr:MBL fold metallo-hydrolase [Clostridium autoethanogenum]